MKNPIDCFWVFPPGRTTNPHPVIKATQQTPRKRSLFVDRGFFCVWGGEVPEAVVNPEYERTESLSTVVAAATDTGVLVLLKSH